MNAWLFVIPFVSAFIGWWIGQLMIKILFHPVRPVKIAGFTIQGVFPKRQQQLAEKLGRLLVSGELFSAEEIGEKITRPEMFKKIMPLVEVHIDNFLKVKLPENMPMISMFIGEKTITQLKTVFLAELELLFPEVMKNYIKGLQEDTNLEKILVAKLSSFPGEKLEKLLFLEAGKELRWIGIMGGILGFVIGSLQVLITLLIR
jgi:uncharacterized membrane protein YheB (UPF0754 family)